METDKPKITIFADIDDTCVQGYIKPGSMRINPEPLDMMVVRAYAKEGFIDDSYVAKTIGLYKKMMRGKISIGAATKEFYPMMTEAKAGKPYADAVDIIKRKVTPHLMLYPRVDYMMGAIRKNPDKISFCPVTFNWKETIEAIHERLPFEMSGVYNEQLVDESGRFVGGKFVREVTADKTIPFDEHVGRNHVQMKYTIGLGDSLLQDGWVTKTRFSHLFNASKAALVKQVTGRESLIDPADFREAFDMELQTLLGELNGVA